MSLNGLFDEHTEVANEGVGLIAIGATLTAGALGALAYIRKFKKGAKDPEVKPVEKTHHYFGPDGTSFGDVIDGSTKKIIADMVTYVVRNPESVAGEHWIKLAKDFDPKAPLKAPDGYLDFLYEEIIKKNPFAAMGEANVLSTKIWHELERIKTSGDKDLSKVMGWIKEQEDIVNAFPVYVKGKKPRGRVTAADVMRFTLASEVVGRWFTYQEIEETSIPHILVNVLDKEPLLVRMARSENKWNKFFDHVMAANSIVGNCLTLAGVKRELDDGTIKEIGNESIDFHSDLLSEVNEMKLVLENGSVNSWIEKCAEVLDEANSCSGKLVEVLAGEEVTVDTLLVEGPTLAVNVRETFAKEFNRLTEDLHGLIDLCLTGVDIDGMREVSRKIVSLDDSTPLSAELLEAHVRLVNVIKLTGTDHELKGYDQTTCPALTLNGWREYHLTTLKDVANINPVTVESFEPLVLTHSIVSGLEQFKGTDYYDELEYVINDVMDWVNTWNSHLATSGMEVLFDNIAAEVDKLAKASAKANVLCVVSERLESTDVEIKSIAYGIQSLEDLLNTTKIELVSQIVEAELGLESGAEAVPVSGFLLDLRNLNGDLITLDNPMVNLAVTKDGISNFVNRSVELLGNAKNLVSTATTLEDRLIAGDTITDEDLFPLRNLVSAETREEKLASLAVELTAIGKVLSAPSKTAEIATMWKSDYLSNLVAKFSSDEFRSNLVNDHGRLLSVLEPVMVTVNGTTCPTAIEALLATTIKELTTDVDEEFLETVSKLDSLRTILLAPRVDSKIDGETNLEGTEECIEGLQLLSSAEELVKVYVNILRVISMTSTVLSEFWFAVKPLSNIEVVVEETGEDEDSSLV